MPRVHPFAHLGLIHEPVRHLAVDGVPFVDPADEAGHKVVDRLEPGVSQGNQRLLQDGQASIIEGEGDGVRGRRTFAGVQRHGSEPGVGQLPHLPREKALAHVDAAQFRPGRFFSHLVIANDRQPRGKKPPEGGEIRKIDIVLH